MSTAPTLRPIGSAGGAVSDTAEHAALSALVNTFLRETGQHDPRIVEGDPLFRVRLSATGQVLSGTIVHWSPMGHHGYGPDFALCSPNSENPVESAHRELVEALVAEAAHLCDDAAGDTPADTGVLVDQIADSLARTTRYLDQDRAVRPTEPRALTRFAEQSIHLGHPMHPTPKNADGFSDDDLAAYAPELSAQFALHYLAIEQDLLREDRVAPGEWIPETVSHAATAELGSRRGNYHLLPIHPWQAKHLDGRPAFRELIARGALVPLGALGDPVYPTSSVRTVCDPTFTTVWKLPLRVRITNFFRTNPLEHVQRAADASRVIASLRPDWAYPEFEVLIETGYRTVRDSDLAEDLSVLFRENPFTESGTAPQVLAGLLEQRPGGVPDLVGYVREAAGLCYSSTEPVAAEVVVEWLRRYLAISLLPMLDLWTEHGVSLEAHTQNSLLHLSGGWPSRCYVRDMEGVSISRRAKPLTELLPADSPLIYDDDQAWLRLQYYLITNHLGHLVHVLSRCGRATEQQLWGVLADTLSGHAEAEGGSYLTQLRRAPTLPAKANLISRMAQRSERPLYVDVPNPMREVRI